MMDLVDLYYICISAVEYGILHKSEYLFIMFSSFI